jgi:Straboviridae putative endonuclease SegB
MANFFCVYKISNLINQKFYIGAHATDDLEDHYMGSGLSLRRAIKKYGIQNFKKEIIHICSSLDEMYDREKEELNKVVGHKMCYNIHYGGKSWHSDPKAQRKFNWVFDEGLMKKHNQKLTEENRKLKRGCAFNEDLRKRGVVNAALPEANERRKRTFVQIHHQQGEKNNQFGTCWVFDPLMKIEKKIRKEELNFFLLNGWIRGRKLKHI